MLLYNKMKALQNKKKNVRACLAQSVEHQTFNLRVVGSSLTVGRKTDVF